MNSRIIIAVLVFIVLTLSWMSALTVETPYGGFIREKLFPLRVTGAPPLLKIQYNGIPFLAKTTGEFERLMLASRGLNTVSVSDSANLENAASVSFYADVPPTTLKVILYWDTDNTDLDLHVTEPDGTECFYGTRETPLGGRLDVDVTTGYGPEIYVMEFPNPGTYRVFIHYYGGAELTEATVVTIANEGTSREKRQSFSLRLTIPGQKVEIGKAVVEK